MRDSFLKYIINIVAFCVLIRLLYEINETKNIWETSEPLDFSQLEKIEDINCTVQDVIYLNQKVSNKLDQLRKTLFFKIFKVNLEEECSYFMQNMICDFPSCSVCQCQDKEIPLPWKQESSKKEKVDIGIEEKFRKWIDKYNTSSSQWLPDYEINSEEGIFVDLIKNPEAYTGYQGQHIWNAIFRENCFSDSIDKICTEERIFYRILSGLLTNINVQLSVNYANISKNKTYINLNMFKERVFNHPDRVDNLFFLYSLLIKSFNKAEFLIKNVNLDTGNKDEDQKARKIIDEIYQLRQFKVLRNKSIYDQENLRKFLNFNNVNILMTRLRNISTIMDCVSCQKCKLHGKLQIYGLATMLKILNDKNYSSVNKKSINLDLTRNELIAFVNLLGKVSKSINYFLMIDQKIKTDNWIYKCKYIFFILIYLLIFYYVNFYLSESKNTNGMKSKKILSQSSRNSQNRRKYKTK